MAPWWHLCRTLAMTSSRSFLTSSWSKSSTCSHGSHLIWIMLRCNFGIMGSKPMGFEAFFCHVSYAWFNKPLPPNRCDISLRAWAFHTCWKLEDRWSSQIVWDLDESLSSPSIKLLKIARFELSTRALVWRGFEANNHIVEISNFTNNWNLTIGLGVVACN